MPTQNQNNFSLEKLATNPILFLIFMLIFIAAYRKLTASKTVASDLPQRNKPAYQRSIDKLLQKTTITRDQLLQLETLVSDILLTALNEPKLKLLLAKHAQNLVNPLWAAYYASISDFVFIHNPAGQTIKTMVYAASSVDIIFPLSLLTHCSAPNVRIYMLDNNLNIFADFEKLKTPTESMGIEVEHYINSRMRQQGIIVSSYTASSHATFKPPSPIDVLKYFLRSLRIKPDVNYQNYSLSFKFGITQVELVFRAADLKNIRTFNLPKITEPYLFLSKAALDLHPKDYFPGLWQALGQSPDFAVITSNKLNPEYSYYLASGVTTTLSRDQILNLQFSPAPPTGFELVQDKTLEQTRAAIKELSVANSPCETTDYHLPALFARNIKPG